MTGRNDRGMLMPLVLVLLVLVVFAGIAVTTVAIAGWKSALRVDADTEAANILASAQNIIDTLVTGVDNSPENACLLIHAEAPSTPPSDCTAPPTDWTAWMPLPSRDGCNDVLEGCWRARFSTTDITIDLEGQQQQTLTAWTVEVEAAARCDLLPTDADPAEERCEVVTDPAVLSYEPLPLPLYANIVGGSVLNLVPPEVLGAPDPADAREVVLHGTYGGVFINSTGGIAGCDPRDATNPCASSPDDLITLEDVNVAEDACGTSPAVLSWVGGTTQTASELSTYPGAGLVIVSAPDDGDPATPASGSIRITGNIDGDDPNTPELEALLIVSGCHIIIDAPCVFGALTTTDPASAPQTCDGSALDTSIYDPTLGRRVPVTLTNVVIVAAGGVWAADLQPIGCAYDATAPALTITGSVITGHAAATSLLDDCDGDVLNGQEAVIAGHERLSSLPDADEWATADIAWWPGRDEGVWRRR